VLYFLSLFYMESTLFLAKIMGVMFAVIGLAILFDTKYYMKAFEDFFKNKGLMYVTGFIILIMGLLLVLVHNRWTEDWTVVITILAWLTFLKGLFFMLFPSWMVGFSKKFMTKSYLTGSGVFALLLGLCLIYKGFEIVF